MYDIAQVQSVYDALSDKIKQDLDEQFLSGRIKGTEYANTYIQLMNTVLQLAFKAPIEDKNQQLLQKQIELAEKDLELKDKEILLKDKDLELKSQELEIMKLQAQKIPYEINEIQNRTELIRAQMNETLNRTELIREQINELDYTIKNILPLKASQEQAKINEINKQIELYHRQIKGFDDNLKLETFKAQINGVSMCISSGMLEDIPSALTDDQIVKPS